MTLSHANTDSDGEVGAVEFIDRPSSVESRPDHHTSGSTWSWVGVVALIVAGVWAVSVVGSPDPTRQGQAAPRSSPPADLEPALRPSWVVARSGPQPSLGSPPESTATTLVYLSTDGLPVAVSIATGGIDVLDVDPARRAERFAVTDASRLVLDRSDAGDAVVFDLLTGSNQQRELCVRRSASVDPTAACPDATIAISDDLVVERYEPGRHWALAPLLEEASIVGGRLTSDEGFWIPVPTPSSIWVVGPPERGGAAADIGRL